MASKILVLVTDRDDSKHGEITVLDDPRKAERLVETLIEAGFERERVRIFNGAEMDIQVSHRPVVSLLGEPEPGDESETVAEAPVDEEPVEEQEVQPILEETVETESEEEPEPATAFVQNGVRFSTLFRQG